MARVWSSGFELNSVGIEWDGNNGAPTIQTTTVRSGTYALQIASLVSTTQKHVFHQLSSVNSNGPFYFRFYFRYATAPLIDDQIFNLRSSGGVRIAFILINSSGALELWDEDGQIGSDSSALSTDTWYRVEVKFDGSPAGGSDEVRALIDGTEFAGSATRDLSAGLISAYFGGNLNGEASVTGEWYFDDIAINNSTGSFQNSYPGEGEIIHLRPNAAGDNADWTRGGTDSGANFSQCDEIAPNDATDYVQSNTNNQIDDYNLDATPAALESTDVVNVVQVGCRLRVDDATGADPSFVLRIKDSSGGTVEESASQTPNSTVWVGFSAASPRNYVLTLYDLPGASTTAWTKATLDTAQIGVRESNTDTHNAQVTTLWLLVDHKPGAVAFIAPKPLVIAQAVNRAATY